MENGIRIGLGEKTEKDRSRNGSGLSAHRHWSAKAAQPREVSPSTTLFLQGNPPKEVFYVERGLVKLLRLNESGQEFVVGLQSQGSILRAASVIVREPYPFTATTITSCALTPIPADLFLNIVKTDEKFGWYLHEVHSREVHRHVSQLTALKYLSARQRFERFLLQFLSSIQLHEQQTSIKIRLPLKRWEIAQLIGIRPEHLSRILQQIKREGLLHEEDGYMIVSDVRKISVHDECG